MYDVTNVNNIFLINILCFNSLCPVNVTGQGNGLRSQIVSEKWGGPGITVKANFKKNDSINSIN